MQKIRVKRSKYIYNLLRETQKEFASRGIEITIDQAHALHDVRYWTSKPTVKATVDLMIEEDLELLETVVMK